MKWLWIILLIFPLCSNASYAIYPFASPEKEQRFHELLKEFRCLVCQNENLADSNAPLAADLRSQIYTMVNNDQSNAVIEDYLVKRYGTFVLYQPPFQANTFILWLAPILLLLLGMTIWGILLARSRIV